MENKNHKVIMLQLFAIVLAIVGVTIAISYLMEAINFKSTGVNLAVDYTGTLTLPTTRLYPIEDSEVDTNTENVMRVNFSVKGASTNNTSKPIIYDVILSNLDIDCELKSEYLKWRLYKNDSLLYEGSFSPNFDMMKDNKLWLTEEQQKLPSNSANADSYEFVVWLSEACSDITSCTLERDQSNLFGKTISGKIETILHTGVPKQLVREKYTTSFSCPNSPDLVEGLVPITYSDDKWVKANSNNENNNWYSYIEKKWANAVLVTSDYRDENNNDTFNIGDEIPEDAILAYYVWIPRYKYKVFNITKTKGTDSYNAKTTGIDIKFERGINTTGIISCNYDFSVTNGNLSETCSGENGEYYTHPAFTFGNDELRGIWVSKFEISPPTDSACYETANADNCNNTMLAVRSKPNVNSWRYNKLTNFSYVIQNMGIPDNEYGLKTDSNSHMIKNMEWGAVAYFANSEYGKCNNGNCEEVALNSYVLSNNSEYKTGCGPQSIEGSSSYGDVCYVYNSKIGQLSSTTTNVYGVYDMSGGAREHVMGNMSSTEGSYIYYASSAGDNFVYSADTEKYIDTYAYGTSYNDQIAYNRARLGDATGEVANSSNFGWYDDYAEFVKSTTSWFNRGGESNDGRYGGMFNFYNSIGSRYFYYSSRAVLVSQQ